MNCSKFFDIFQKRSMMECVLLKITIPVVYGVIGKRLHYKCFLRIVQKYFPELLPGRMVALTHFVSVFLFISVLLQNIRKL